MIEYFQGANDTFLKLEDDLYIIICNAVIRITSIIINDIQPPDHYKFLKNYKDMVFLTYTLTSPDKKLEPRTIATRRVLSKEDVIEKML